MRPVPKRVFALRYIESLGQKIMVVRRTGLLKMFACPTEKIGCPGPSEPQIFEPSTTVAGNECLITPPH